jgi:hypothetical protein
MIFAMLVDSRSIRFSKAASPAQVLMNRNLRLGLMSNQCAMADMVGRVNKLLSFNNLQGSRRCTAPAEKTGLLQPLPERQTRFS